MDNNNDNDDINDKMKPGPSGWSGVDNDRKKYTPFYNSGGHIWPARESAKVAGSIPNRILPGADY